MIVILASELTEDLRFCTKCGKPLSGKVAMLEFDQRSSEYHDRSDVPAELSQGWFPFGVDCATKLSKKSMHK